MDDLAAIARGIIDDNVYMTIGTASAEGNPWAAPVFFAVSADYRSYYWISSPLALHSRNIAAHPSVSLVIFDSRVRVGDGQAVYMSATASKLSTSDLPSALSIYPGPASRGGRAIDLSSVTGSAPYRLFRAVSSRFWTLDPTKSPDQRTPISLIAPS